MSKAEANRLLKDLEKHLDELPMHLYMMIWAVTQMNTLYATDSKNPKFNTICFPYTAIPLFSKEEAKNLETLWKHNIAGNEHLFDEAEAAKPQKGGRGVPKSFAELKAKSKEFGQAMEIATKALDPKLISPDYVYEYTTDLLDSVDSKLTEASGTVGLVALESTVPDPTVVIPTPVPIPVQIPAKTILPVINALLEAARITVSIVFLFDPLGVGALTRSVLTLIMVLLDLGRGNLYHAIFTSFGFIGSTPMFVGIGMKIVRDAIMLVSPDLRTQLRFLMFQSSKSFVVGFAIWLFTVLSPRFVKEQIRLLFDTVATTLDNINLQLSTTEEAINKTPVAALAEIKMPRIPGDAIPDINNLYALREAVRQPAIYCDEKIADLMNELRGVPPYALFLDLALIPAPGSDEFDKQCVAFKGKTISESLVSLTTPQVVLAGTDTPISLDSLSDPQVLAEQALGQTELGQKALEAKAALNDPEAAAKAALGKTELGQKALEAKAALNDPEAAAKAALGKTELGQKALEAKAVLNNPEAAFNKTKV